MNITIIGAGPAGCYTAELLAKQGHDVTLVEEHKHIGSPVQCTGIVTHSIDKFLELPKKIIANNMDTVEVITKNNKTSVEVDEVVMWRNKFDAWLGERAEDAGVKVLTEHKFVSLTNKEVTIKEIKDKKNKVKKIESDLIIGADGPSSPVAKAAYIPHHNKFYIGMQAKVKLNNQTNVFGTHFGTKFPEFFGWVVPESEDIVRLGLGATNNAQKYFYQFLKTVTGKKDIECWESGIIPIHNPRQQIQKDNIYLIGDAASQVKATTGGGIIPHLKAAHTLVDCIQNKKNYNTQYKLQSGKELLAHLYLRKILNRFTDKDYDELADIMNSSTVKKLLKKYDRDTPLPLLLGLAIKQPRLYKFVKVLMQKSIMG